MKLCFFIFSLSCLWCIQVISGTYNGYYVTISHLTTCVSECVQGSNKKIINLREIDVNTAAGPIVYGVDFSIRLSNANTGQNSYYNNGSPDTCADDNPVSTCATEFDNPNPIMVVSMSTTSPTSITYTLTSGYHGYLYGAKWRVYFNDVIVQEEIIASYSTTQTFHYTGNTNPNPTASPTPLPTAVPTTLPTAMPTTVPTVSPTTVPTSTPTPLPTALPTANPSAVPTAVPSAVPTASPTTVPTVSPTAVPTAVPTVSPTSAILLGADWGAQKGTNADDNVYGLALDSGDDVLVAGDTKGSLFGANAGGTDYWLAKYSGSDGSLVWGQQAGSSFSEAAHGVATDSSGDVFVAGQTSSSLYDTHSGSGDDYFMAKYAGTDGSLLWGEQISTSGDVVWANNALNPNGVWEYGHMAAGNVFVLGTRVTFGVSGGTADGFASEGAILYKKLEGVGRMCGVANGELGLSCDSGSPALRFSAPEEALYSFTINVGGSNAASEDGCSGNGNVAAIYVLINGAANHAVDSSGNTRTFAASSIVLEQGQAIDLVVPEKLGSGNHQVSFSVTTTNPSQAWDASADWGATLSPDALANAVAVDSSGDVFVAGYTASTLHGTHYGDADTWLAKRSGSDGSLMWDVQDGTSTTEFASGLAVSATGDVYTVGRSLGDLYGTNAGLEDAWVTRHRGSDGLSVWEVQYGTTSADYALGVAVDGSGDVIVAGFLNGGSLYDTNIGGNDCFLSKLRGSDGSLLWGVQYGTPADDASRAVAVDSNGDVYAGGHTSGSLYDVNIGDDDSFVAKFSGADGSFLWGKQFGRIADDRVYSLGVGIGGDVFTGGASLSSLFGTNAGGWDAVLSQFSRSPTGEPSGQPTALPSVNLSHAPTGGPSGLPTALPSRDPTHSTPTLDPTGFLSDSPTSDPSAAPTALPTPIPSAVPSLTVAVEDTSICAMASVFNFSFSVDRDIKGWTCDVDGRPITASNSTTFCEDAWEGLSCEERNGDIVVTQINVSNLGVSGTLPEEIGLFRHLEVLDVSANSIVGPLPASIGGLHSLLELRLQNNSLGVTRTSEAAVLVASSEEIEDNVDISLSRISNLTSLSVLDIGTNEFRGVLPDSFCSLNALTSFHVSGNRFDCVASCLLSSETVTVISADPLEPCDEGQSEGGASCASRASGHVIGVLLVGIFLSVGYRFVSDIYTSVPRHVWSYMFLWRIMFFELLDMTLCLMNLAVSSMEVDIGFVIYLFGFALNGLVILYCMCMCRQYVASPLISFKSGHSLEQWWFVLEEGMFSDDLRENVMRKLDLLDEQSMVTCLEDFTKAVTRRHHNIQAPLFFACVTDVIDVSIVIYNYIYFCDSSSGKFWSDVLTLVSLFVVLFNVFDAMTYWTIAEEAEEFEVKSQEIFLKYREYSKDFHGANDGSESTSQDDNMDPGSSSSSSGFSKFLRRAANYTPLETLPRVVASRRMFVCVDEIFENTLSLVHWYGHHRLDESKFSSKIVTTKIIVRWLVR